MPEKAWWQTLFQAIDAKDVPGFMSFLTPDAEFRFASAPSVYGHDAVGALVRGFWDAIGGSRHRLIRSWEDAETAVCEGEVTYTRKDGSTLTVPFVNVFYLRDGKIARYLIHIDNSGLFA